MAWQQPTVQPAAGRPRQHMGSQQHGVQQLGDVLVARGIGAAAITAQHAHRGEESGGTSHRDGAPREGECGQQQELQEVIGAGAR
jgi:hypothetical protein